MVLTNSRPRRVLILLGGARPITDNVPLPLPLLLLGDKGNDDAMEIGPNGGDRSSNDDDVGVTVMPCSSDT